MQAASPHPDYPLEVTHDEARAGFEQLILSRLVDPDFQDRWTLVVGKVLGSSDVIVKIGRSAYSHRRFGSFESPFVSTRPQTSEWMPVGNPYIAMEQAIFEAEIGASAEDGPKVIPANAEIRRPEQGAAHNGP